MTRALIPVVVDERLFSAGNTEDAATAFVGSQSWYTWLEDKRHRSFSFRCRLGIFTARCERQRGGWYWYAYRKREGKTYKTYLGRSGDLSLERLNVTAAQLAAKSNGCPAQTEKAACQPVQPLYALATQPSLREPVEARHHGLAVAHDIVIQPGTNSAPSSVSSSLSPLNLLPEIENGLLSQDAPTAFPIEPLTGRERDVLLLLMKGASNREIAQRLVISEGTAKKHVSNICSKLHVQRRSQVIVKALALALL